MDRSQAIGIVKSIIESHKDALRVTDSKCVEILENAESDLIQLVRKIFDECADGDFDDHAVDAIKLSQPSE